MKVLYVSTISNTINAFLIPHIELLLEQGHNVDIVCNIKRDISPILIKRGCKVFNIEFQRSPIKKQNYLAFKKLKKLIQDEKYDLVHTHTPTASVISRLACKKLKNITVIYTAHGFHFFKGAPIKNWLLYYPFERWLARYTDVLITINKEDFARAQTFKAKRVEYVPGVGLDTDKYSGLIIDKLAKRRELGVSEEAFVILSVGELNKNKNHETVIKAISKLQNLDIYYVICGSGVLNKYLKELAISLGIAEKVILLGYRTDVNEIYHAADIFALPSYREGLPVSLMEAMATGLPVVCSDIRGNRDLINNKIGGYLVKPDNVDGFAASIKNCIEHKDTCKLMGLHNTVTIIQFDSAMVKLKLSRLYNAVTNW